MQGTANLGTGACSSINQEPSTSQTLHQNTTIQKTHHPETRDIKKEKSTDQEANPELSTDENQTALSEPTAPSTGNTMKANKEAHIDTRVPEENQQENIEAPDETHTLGDREAPKEVM